jgi:hypothetical protein
MHVCGSRTSKLAVVDVVLVGSGLSTRVKLRSWNKKNEIRKYEKKKSRLEATGDQIKNIKITMLDLLKREQKLHGADEHDCGVAGSCHHMRGVAFFPWICVSASVPIAPDNFARTSCVRAA